MQYFEPNFLDEALVLLDRFGAAARILAGGTRLGPSLRGNTDAAAALVNIKRIRELSDIEERDAKLRIGSLATASALAANRAVQRHAPLLARAAAGMGARQLQTIATLGGNVCSGDPASDLSVALLACDAWCEIAAGEARSMRSIDRLLERERPVLGPNELLCAVEIACAPRRCSYQKMTTRAGFEMSLVAVAFACRLEAGTVLEPRIALGGAAGTPIRARDAENLLAGKPWTAETARSAARQAAERDATPRSDARASEAYRRQLVAALAYRAIMDCHD